MKANLYITKQADGSQSLTLLGRICSFVLQKVSVPCFWAGTFHALGCEHDILVKKLTLLKTYSASEQFFVKMVVQTSWDREVTDLFTDC